LVFQVRPQSQVRRSPYGTSKRSPQWHWMVTLGGATGLASLRSGIHRRAPLYGVT
jgi:hypothetical protein